MKVVHLGDLHLGIRFHKRSLIDDQRYVLKQILQIIDKEKAHTVIAGDVYDTVNPSVEAQELWYEFLGELDDIQEKNHTETIIISGNHDSHRRLALSQKFLARGNIHVVDPTKLCQVVVIDDIPFVCIPFVRPVDVNRHYGTNFEMYDNAYDHLINDVLSVTFGKKCVLVAHQTFEGAVKSNSEFKPFMPDAINVDTVSPFSAVMAGHLHAKQSLKNIRYSGSMLCYAFGDDYKPTITVWDSGGLSNEWTFEEHPIEVLHPLQIVSGNLATCLKNADPNCYLKVKLVGAVHFEEAVAVLHDKFPNLLLVTTDQVDHWVADTDKPVGVFTNVQEAIDSFCEFLEIPPYTGRKQQILEEAINAFTQTED